MRKTFRLMMCGSINKKTGEDTFSETTTKLLLFGTVVMYNSIVLMVS